MDPPHASSPSSNSPSEPRRSSSHHHHLPPPTSDLSDDPDEPDHSRSTSYDDAASEPPEQHFDPRHGHVWRDDSVDAHGPPGWAGRSSSLIRAFLSKISSPFTHDEYMSIGNHAEKPPTASSASLLAASLAQLLLSSKINLLIVFVPVGVATAVTQCPAPWVFATNAMAIIPLSSMLTNATERIAADAGDTVGALLNISLGNLVELILLVALSNGHLYIVQASTLGSILVNTLLILGTALLGCSFFDTDTTPGSGGTQILGGLLFVSVFVFLMPTAFQFAFRDSDKIVPATLMMTRITAGVVLAIYILYIFHELRYPKNLDRKSSLESATGHEVRQLHSLSRPPSSSRTHPTGPLVLPQRTVRFADQDMADDRVRLSHNGDGDGGDDGYGDEPLDPAEDQRGRRPGRLTRRTSGLSSSAYRTSSSAAAAGDLSRPMSADSAPRPTSRDSSVGGGNRRVFMGPVIPTLRAQRTSLDLPPRIEHHRPASVGNVAIDRIASIIVLVLSSGLMSMNAEFLVSTIDQITHAGRLSESFIGLIILPVVGNMAEYITVVTVAIREKPDLAIAVSVGSSIQVALCVAPLAVISSWIMHKDLLMTFNTFEMAALIGTVLLVNIILLSDTLGGPISNTLRGGLTCGCYAIIAIGAYLTPQ